MTYLNLRGASYNVFKMPSDSVKRLVAQKVSIKDLLQGEYIKEAGWNPNYIITKEKKISRVNIMAVVLSTSNRIDTSYYSFVLDDGTGKISVRGFEKNDVIENLEIGDVVLLIGRIREFGQERYIIPEIIKKIKDQEWIEVRKLELKKSTQTIKGKVITREVEENIKPLIKEETIMEPSSQLIYELIKNLDNGNGVEIDNIIKNSKLDNTEEIISNLLQEGEIFELKPGKLKVLE